MAHQHPVTGKIHLLDLAPRPGWLQNWEKLAQSKFPLLIECIAEFFGVWFYVYCGVGAQVAFNVGNLAKITGIGSLLTIGFAYGFGIALAVAICAPVAGGHFNPCVTIAKVVWKGFPAKKVAPYIIAQILGAYFASILVYAQYRSTIVEIEQVLKKLGQYNTTQFTPSGLAGTLAIYPRLHADLRYVFVNEFFASFFVGFVIWGILDSTNVFISPVAAPWVVGLAYVAIWDFAPGTVALNTARDVGGRLAAMSIWGMSASGGKYAAIAALTNIPATLLATLVYELFFADSSRVVPEAQLSFLGGFKAQIEHRKLTQSTNGILVGGPQGSDEGLNGKIQD